MNATRLILGALALGLLFGCGPNPAGKVPTTIPLTTFQPADADELFPDEADDEADADADAAAGTADGE